MFGKHSVDQSLTSVRTEVEVYDSFGAHTRTHTLTQYQHYYHYGAIGIVIIC